MYLGGDITQQLTLVTTYCGVVQNTGLQLTLSKIIKMRIYIASKKKVTSKHKRTPNWSIYASFVLFAT